MSIISHNRKSGQADDTPVKKCVFSQTKQGDDL